MYFWAAAAWLIASVLSQITVAESIEITAHVGFEGKDQLAVVKLDTANTWQQKRLMRRVKKDPPSRDLHSGKRQMFMSPVRSAFTEFDNRLGAERENKTNKVIMLKPSVTDSQIDALCTSGTETSICSYQGHPSLGGVPFVVISATDEEIASVIGQDGVADIISSVDEDSDMGVVSNMDTTGTSAREGNISWGLDRIDERLDFQCNVPLTGGKGVHVYVLGTGIRTTHQDFEDATGSSRAIPTLDLSGDAVGDFASVECDDGDTSCAVDSHGHGTSCAGIIGGKNHGIAKGVTLHAVKVLKDTGTGVFSSLLRAIDWILIKGERPAVISANVFASGKRSFVEDAIKRANESGITVVVPAGNTNTDACNSTPAYTSNAITVGATNINDEKTSFSSYGVCVDLFAPGQAVDTDGHISDDATSVASSTSVSASFVTGAAALLLARDPDVNVQNFLVAAAAADNVTNVMDSPNLLLHINTGLLPSLSTVGGDAAISNASDNASSDNDTGNSSDNDMGSNASSNTTSNASVEGANATHGISANVTNSTHNLTNATHNLTNTTVGGAHAGANATVGTQSTGAGAQAAAGDDGGPRSVSDSGNASSDSTSATPPNTSAKPSDDDKGDDDVKPHQRVIIFVIGGAVGLVVVGVLASLLLRRR